MAHWWNEWQENEVLGHCPSVASVTSSTWIGVCLDLGLSGWRLVTNRLRVFSLCLVLYVYLYVRVCVCVAFKWNRLDTHTYTRCIYIFGVTEFFQKII